MSIVVSCDCGKRLRARDEDAGKRAKCPGCGKTLVVPQKESDSDLYDLSEPAPTLPPKSARPEPVIRPAAATIKAPGISRPAATTVAMTQAAMSSRSAPQSVPSPRSTQSG